MKKLLIATILAAGTTVAATAASATTYWVEYGITLNARSGPGTNYYVKGTFPSCTALNVVDYHGSWAKILWNHNYYWVSSRYLQKHECSYQAPRKKKYYGGGSGGGSGY